MVSKSESSLVLASTSHQDRVFRRDSDFEASTQKAAERKCLAALKLANEADATRTRNLRIDSPTL